MKQTRPLLLAGLLTLLFNTSASAAYPSVYYESIAGSELIAISLSDPVQGVGFRSGDVTNIALAGGKVYFQEGVNIYVANPDLSGVTLFHTNGVAPTDLDVYVAASVPEPSTWGLLLLGMGLLGGWPAWRRSARRDHGHMVNSSGEW